MYIYQRQKKKELFVLKIGNLYQVKTEDGKVRSYLADELEGQINE